MYRAFEGLLEAALDAAIAGGELVVSERPACRLEPPEHPVFGDATSRVALGIARRIGRPAPDVARTLVRHVADPHGWVEHIEAAGPGFVNVRASLAFWRAALAARVWGGPDVARERRRAIVIRVAPPDEARTAIVADGLARLLAAVGHDVERVAAPVAVLATTHEPSAVGRVVAVYAASDRLAMRGAKDAFARAGGRPGDVAGVGVGPLVIRRRGQPLAPPDAASVLATPAARFALAATPIGAPALLDVERLALDRIDNPWVAVRYALVRIARVGGQGACDRDGLDALGEADRECLRTACRHPDVVALAARRLEPAALAAQACGLAAAFHRHYNRGAFAGGDAGVMCARRALACGVARVLEATLGMLDACPAERT